MEAEEPRVLTDDEAWKLGLTQRALAMCEEGDLLVGIVQSRGEYLAVIYTEIEGRRYADIYPLKGA
jgi:hypothetical protein